jgi:ADP-heptose:LPS heptosyltransferase
MVSSILRQVLERFPERRYNLVDRTSYRAILEGHPAIDSIGHPPRGAKTISTRYWLREEFNRPGARAYQTLARIFGLDLPVEERLYVPWEPEECPLLLDGLPPGRPRVLICPTSRSPRKELPLAKWEALVEGL